MNNASALFPILTFVLGIILKTVLDLNTAVFLVKYLSWINFRSIFRIKVHNVSGKWNQLWDSKTSIDFLLVSERQSEITIKQLGKFFYFEFVSKEIKYYAFGEIIDRRLVGKWADRASYLGYFGAFELTIIDPKRMEGVWLGHSHRNANTINSNTWTITR